MNWTRVRRNLDDMEGHSRSEVGLRYAFLLRLKVAGEDSQNHFHRSKGNPEGQQIDRRLPESDIARASPSRGQEEAIHHQDLRKSDISIQNK